MEFKVEQSGFYRTRDGQEVECVAIWTRPCGNGFQATFLDKNEAYNTTINGRYFIDPEYEHGLDVVEYLGKERPAQRKVVRMAPALILEDDGGYHEISREIYPSEKSARNDQGDFFVRWLIDSHGIEVEVPDNG